MYQRVFPRASSRENPRINRSYEPGAFSFGCAVSAPRRAFSMSSNAISRAASNALLGSSLPTWYPPAMYVARILVCQEIRWSSALRAEYLRVWIAAVICRKRTRGISPICSSVQPYSLATRSYAAENPPTSPSGSIPRSFARRRASAWARASAAGPSSAPPPSELSEESPRGVFPVP